MPSRARSLAEDLRGRSDDQLALLLRLRPGLLRPVPKSFSDLALRANSASSVIEALDDLTAAQLDVLEACCALAPDGRFGLADVSRGLDAEPVGVATLVDDLLDRVLLWGGSDDLRVPSAVREVMGPEAGGLDEVVRPGFAPVRQLDPMVLAERLQLAPPAAADLIRDHAWGPAGLPDGTATDWLVAHGLAAEDEAGRVLVPREVAWVLRRGQLLLDPRLVEPALPQPDSDAVAAADRHAGYAADQFVRDVDRVIGYLTTGALGRQANGAFSARDFDRLVAAVPIGTARLGLILSLLWQLGWVGMDDDRRVRPTVHFREEADAPVARRWALLLDAWRRSGRPATSDPARVLALPDDPASPKTRELVLTALRAGAGAEVGAWLAWWRPRRPLDPAQIAVTVSEAEMIGASFAGILSAPLRDPDTDPAAAIAAHLPPLTDQIILQADLTATALGPLIPAVERRLAELADWESGGGATVFRFSPQRIRATLARGADPQQLIDWLTGIAATDVPQALQFMIKDNAAVLPHLTVHRATTVVTGSMAEVSAVLGDAELARAGLRQVAPGVLVSDLAPGELSELLRASGRSAEQPDQPATMISPDLPPRPAQGATPLPTRVVASLRRVEDRGTPTAHPPETLRSSGPAELIDVLQRAVIGHERMWLSFAGDGGDRITHLAEPLALDAGELCAFDHTAGEIRTIPLARIVAFADAMTPPAP